MRYSHADHTKGQIHLALLQLVGEDSFPVSTLASLAGCSESLVYQWTQGKAIPSGHFLMALAYRLAAEYSNYRLATLALPPGLRLTRVKVATEANGCLNDEAADLSLAIANALVAHRGGDADGVAQAFDAIASGAARAKLEQFAAFTHSFAA